MVEKILKNILLFITCFIVFLIQSYVLNGLLIVNIEINLILITLIIITTKFSIVKSIVTAICFGLFIDIFTVFKFSGSFFPYVVTIFIIYNISKIYKNDNFKTTIYLTIISFIAFESLACVTQIVDIGRVTNFFGYINIVMKAIIINTLAMAIIYKPMSKVIDYLKTDS